MTRYWQRHRRQAAGRVTRLSDCPPSTSSHSLRVTYRRYKPFSYPRDPSKRQQSSPYSPPAVSLFGGIWSHDHQERTCRCRRAGRARHRRPGLGAGASERRTGLHRHCRRAGIRDQVPGNRGRPGHQRAAGRRDRVRPSGIRRHGVLALLLREGRIRGRARTTPATTWVLESMDWGGSNAYRGKIHAFFIVTASPPAQAYVQARYGAHDNLMFASAASFVSVAGLGGAVNVNRDLPSQVDPGRRRLDGTSHVKCLNAGLQRSGQPAGDPVHEQGHAERRQQPGGECDVLDGRLRAWGRRLSSPTRRRVRPRSRRRLRVAAGARPWTWWGAGCGSLCRRRQSRPTARRHPCSRQPSMTGRVRAWRASRLH